MLMAGIGGLTTVFLQGRQERLAAAPAAAREDLDEIVAGPVTTGETARLRAERFESTLEREGVEVFRIRGAQTSSDDRGNVLLEQVEVDYPRGEERYALRADGADYNEKTRATHLRGSVSLEGSNGLRVDTDWLDLAAGGMLLTAADDSRLDLADISARGDGLRMDFREEVARMGDVRLIGTEGADGAGRAGPSAAFSLTAGVLQYEWSAGILRAVRGAEMQVGNLTLSARSLNLYQDETDRFGSLEAQGGIEIRAPMDRGEAAAGKGAVPAGESVLVLRGDTLDVQFDDAELPDRMVLSGPNWGGRAVLRIDHGDGSRRRLRAKLLDVAFVEGAPAEFTAHGRVELQEHAPDREQPGSAPFASAALTVELQEHAPDREQPVRAASSRRAAGRFDAAGALVELRLEEDIRLTDRIDAAAVSGAYEATIDVPTRRADFHGRPARLVHRRGEVEGDRVRYEQANGCFGASGQVRATLGGKGSGEAGEGVLPFGGGDPGPSRITADEALLCETGESRFHGGVEVRQGSGLLAAAQLRIAEDDRKMVATGGVRAVWHAQPAAGAAATGTRTGTEDAPEQWSVTAAHLNLDQDAGELRFSGGAAAVLGERKLECDELTVEAVPGARAAGARGLQAQRLFCLGNARLDEGAAGRSVTAARAVHSLVEQEVRFLGDVVMRKGTAELRGPSLTWWMVPNRYEMGPAVTAAAGAGNP